MIDDIEGRLNSLQREQVKLRESIRPEPASLAVDRAALFFLLFVLGVAVGFIVGLHWSLFLYHRP